MAQENGCDTPEMLTLWEQTHAKKDLHKIQQRAAFLSLRSDRVLGGARNSPREDRLKLAWGPLLAVGISRRVLLIPHPHLVQI